MKINQSAWSASRIKIIRACMRQYFKNYFESDQGWLKTAPKQAQKTYMLKKMTNLPMFVGTIVHNVIEDIIRQTKTKGTHISEKEAKDWAVQELRKGWKESKKRLWEKSPSKYINLSEHYHDEQISKDKANDYKDKMLNCISNFFNSEIFKIIKNLPKENWLSLENFQTFTLQTDEEVIVKLDLAFKYQDKIYLIDWKTGKKNDNVIEQLTGYAMYAMKKRWTTDYKSIRILPVYLLYDDVENDLEGFSVSMEMMQNQARIIQQDAVLLKQAEANKNDITKFPVTENKRVCRFCNFRSDCDGSPYEQKK